MDCMGCPLLAKQEEAFARRGLHAGSMWITLLFIRLASAFGI
jgi:hypothetical protein